MQVWNVLHVARWKCRTQRIAKNSLSGHRCTTSSGYILAIKACINNRKNLLNSNISPTCSHNIVNFGPLTAEICSGVWAHSEFQRVSRLGFVTTVTSLTERQPGLVHYIYILGALAPWRNSATCKIHLRSPILSALLHGTPAAGVSQTLRPGTRNGITELSQRAPPIVGWAAITLGIGPYSSFCCFSCVIWPLSSLQTVLNCEVFLTIIYAVLLIYLIY